MKTTIRSVLFSMRSDVPTGINNVSSILKNFTTPSNGILVIPAIIVQASVRL